MGSIQGEVVSHRFNRTEMEIPQCLYSTPSQFNWGFMLGMVPKRLEMARANTVSYWSPGMILLAHISIQASQTLLYS